MHSAGAGFFPNTNIAGAASACLRHREPRRRHLPRVSCRHGSDDRGDASQQPPRLQLCRREMAPIVLGGLCGVFFAAPMALGKWATPWDPSTTHHAQPAHLGPSTAGGDTMDYNPHATVPLREQNRVDTPKLWYTEAKDEEPTSLLRVEDFGTRPRKLDAAAPLRVLVARPKRNRTKAEKEQEVEVLQISDIQVQVAAPVRFDVYVAAPRGDQLPAGPGLGEFAGSYVRTPSRAMLGAGQGGVRRASLKLGLNSLVEDINAEDAEKLVVTLVLRTGEVTVGGIAINLVKSDRAKVT